MRCPSVRQLLICAAVASQLSQAHSRDKCVAAHAQNYRMTLQHAGLLPPQQLRDLARELCMHLGALQPLLACEAPPAAARSAALVRAPLQASLEPLPARPACPALSLECVEALSRASSILHGRGVGCFPCLTLTCTNCSAAMLHSRQCQF